MNIQEIIARAQTLHDEIDKAAALATKAAPFLVQARGLASSVIGKLNTHNTENPPAPLPATATAAASASSASIGSTTSTTPA